MAFGDGLNDVEMFTAVGAGIAMGDACEALKAVATHVTGTLEEDGIRPRAGGFGRACGARCRACRPPSARYGLHRRSGYNARRFLIFI